MKLVLFLAAFISTSDLRFEHSWAINLFGDDSDVIGREKKTIFYVFVT